MGFSNDLINILNHLNRNCQIIISSNIYNDYGTVKSVKKFVKEIVNEPIEIFYMGNSDSDSIEIWTSLFNQFIPQ